MSCEHPDRDVSYGDTGDYDESKIARCSACGYEWFVSQKEWRELTGFDEGGMRRAKIFDHKWLDPNCVVNGCQSLVLQADRDQALRELGEARDEVLEEAAVGIENLRLQHGLKAAAPRLAAVVRSMKGRKPHAL